MLPASTLLCKMITSGEHVNETPTSKEEILPLLQTRSYPPGRVTAHRMKRQELNNSDQQQQTAKRPVKTCCLSDKFWSPITPSADVNAQLKVDIKIRTPRKLTMKRNSSTTLEINVSDIRKAEFQLLASRDDRTIVNRLDIITTSISFPGWREAQSLDR